MPPPAPTSLLPPPYPCCTQSKEIALWSPLVHRAFIPARVCKVVVLLSRLCASVNLLRAKKRFSYYDFALTVLILSVEYTGEVFLNVPCCAKFTLLIHYRVFLAG